MNNIYKVLIGIFVGVCACFLMFDEVKAIPKDKETKDGYAQCTYRSSKKMYDKYWIVYTWAYYGPKGKPKTGVSVWTYKGNWDDYSQSKEKKIDILNYDASYVSNTEEMIPYFKSDSGKWACRTNDIYIYDKCDNFWCTKSSFEHDPPYIAGVEMVKFDKETHYAAHTHYNVITLQLVKNGNVVSNEKGAVMNPSSNGEGNVVDANGNEMSHEDIKNLNETAKKEATGDLPNTEAIRNYWNNKSGANYGNEQGDCSLIDSSMQSLLNTIFTWVSIIGIILVVALSILDGIKAIAGTEDGFINFLKGLKTRIICLIVLLLAPVIVTFAIQTINGVANIAGVNSDDPLCGVGE